MKRPVLNEVSLDEVMDSLLGGQPTLRSFQRGLGAEKAEKEAGFGRERMNSRPNIPQLFPIC
jgi:hypothetical protein